MKQCLLVYGPCVGAFKVYDGDDLYFWRQRGRMIGGHCVTFVGYDERGIIIRNSWGADWGNNGYVTIPYEEYEQYCIEAWSMCL